MRLRRLLLVELPLASLAYSALAVFLTWPVGRHLGSTVLGPMDSDSAGGIWWLDALQAHGYRLTGSTHFDQIAVPFGLDQANSLNIQWLIPNYPAYLVTKVAGEVVAFNLTILTGFVLSGAAMYALARRIGGSAIVAAWAGAVYIMFPWHVERAVAGHASLVHLECFPVLALSLLHAARKPSLGRVSLVAAAAAACWLTSGYFGVMALASVPAAAFAAALISAPRRRSLKIAAALSLAAVIASGTVAVASIPGGGDGNVGATRSLGDLSVYGVRPLELALPSPGSNLMKRLVPGFDEGRRHGSNIQEVSNFVGWVTMGLAALWLVAAFRRRTRLTASDRLVTLGALGAGTVAFLLAMPNPLIVLGRLITFMPSRLVWEVVPAFRVPSRWSIIVCFSTLIIAVLGFQLVLDTLGTRRAPRVRRFTVIAFCVLAFVGSYGELRVSHPGVYYSATTLPPEYAILEKAPTGGLAEYPFVASENSTNSSYLLWQRVHGRPLLNGAAMGSEAEEVRRTLVDPTAQGAAERLAALGSTVVITRPDTFSRALEQPIPDVAPRLGQGFTRIGSTAGDVTVWAVVAAPAPAIAYFNSAFSIPRRERGLVVQTLVGKAGMIVLRSPAGVRGTLRLHALVSGRGGGRVAIGGRRLVIPPGGAELSLPVVVRAGRTTIPLRDAVVTGDAAGAVSFTAPVIEPR